MIISYPNDGTGTLYHVVDLLGQTVHAYRDRAAAERALEGDQRIVELVPAVTHTKRAIAKYGGTPTFYTHLFTTHSECLVRERSKQASDLMRKLRST